MPKKVLDNWKFEREGILQEAYRQKRSLSDHEMQRLKYLYSSKIEKYLDKLHGDCWLRDPAMAQLTVEALRHFDGTRYNLHAWCVMPNHVHVVFTVISKGAEEDSDLIPIMHSWKSFTAHKANKILKRNGRFWQDEYYDHRIRFDDELDYYVNYTIQNPVTAHLCKSWEDWIWSGCSDEMKKRLSG